MYVCMYVLSELPKIILQIWLNSDVWLNKINLKKIIVMFKLIYSVLVSSILKFLKGEKKVIN